MIEGSSKIIDQFGTPLGPTLDPSIANWNIWGKEELLNLINVDETEGSSGGGGFYSTYLKYDNVLTTDIGSGKARYIYTYYDNYLGLSSINESYEIGPNVNNLLIQTIMDTYNIIEPMCYIAIWGAGGGGGIHTGSGNDSSFGGAGGYTDGYLYGLKTTDILNIIVGQGGVCVHDTNSANMHENHNAWPNGGSNGPSNHRGGGGGRTQISLNDTNLSSLTRNQNEYPGDIDKIVFIAGGGGGNSIHGGQCGNGGGYSGGDASQIDTNNNSGRVGNKIDNDKI